MTRALDPCRIAFAIAALTALRAIGPGIGDPATHAQELIFGFLSVQLLGLLSVTLPRWYKRPLAPAGMLETLIVAHAGLFVFGFHDLAAAAEGRALVSALTVLLFAGNALAARCWIALPVLALAGLHAAAAVATTFLAADATMIGLSAICLICMEVANRIGAALIVVARERYGRPHIPPPPAMLTAVSRIASALALWGWADGSGAAAPALVAAVTGLIWLALLRPWEIRPHAGVVILVIGLMWKRIALLMLWLMDAGIAAIPPHAVIHAFAVGGLATLAVGIGTSIVRKRDGEAMRPSRLADIIYVAIAVAALLRVAAALLPDRHDAFVAAAQWAWGTAFSGVVAYVFRRPLGPVVASASLRMRMMLQRSNTGRAV